MKKINRGDSTTYEVEMRFHELRNETELNNVMDGVGAENFLEIANIVDPETGKPMVFFMISNDLPAINWMKYVAPYDLVSDLADEPEAADQLDSQAFSDTAEDTFAPSQYVELDTGHSALRSPLGA